MNKRFFYPVNMYWPKSFSLFLFGLTPLMLFGAFYYGSKGLPAENFGHYIEMFKSLIFFVISLVAFFMGFGLLLGNSPRIILDEQAISIKHFKMEKYLWKDIKSISLEESPMSNVPMQMLKVLQLKLVMKNGIEVRRSLGDRKIESEIVNPKEIFNLIEQSFKGNNPLNFEKIEMKLDERIQSKKNVAIFFASILLIVYLFVS